MLVKNNFSKNFRLRNKKDFQNLKVNSKKYSSSHFRVYSKKNSSEFSRISFSVSRKCGNAVKRNNIKRILKEAFRISKYKYLGYDALVVINFNRSKEENFNSKLKDEFDKFLNFKG